MPKVEIDSTIVTVKLDDTDTPLADLREQAMASFRDAVEVMKSVGTHSAVGFHVERRDPGVRGYGTQYNQPRPTQEAGDING